MKIYSPSLFLYEIMYLNNLALFKIVDKNVSATYF